jgi:hypothetical protein
MAELTLGVQSRAGMAELTLGVLPRSSTASVAMAPPCRRVLGRVRQSTAQSWSVGSIDPTGFDITAYFSNGTVTGSSGVDMYSAPYHIDRTGKESLVYTVEAQVVRED